MTEHNSIRTDTISSVWAADFISFPQGSIIFSKFILCCIKSAHLFIYLKNPSSDTFKKAFMLRVKVISFIFILFTDGKNVFKVSCKAVDKKALNIAG